MIGSGLFREHSFEGPSMTEAIKECGPFYTTQRCPIIDCFVFNLCSVAILYASWPAIISLLLWSSPAAILRLIITVLIWIAVNALVFWTFPHVGKEITEVSPTWADRNTAASIVFVGWICRTVAAGLHVLPTVKCARSAIRGLSVFCVCLNAFCYRLTHSTAAAYRHASFKTVFINRFLYATVTLAQPTPVSIKFVRNAENQQSPESFSCNVVHIPTITHLMCDWGLYGR